MSSLSPKPRLALSLACGLGFIALLAIISLKSVSGFAQTSREAAAIHDAIEEVDQVQDTLTGVDLLQRQVLRGNASPKVFAYDVERSRFAHRIALLDAALSGTPGSRSHIAELTRVGNALLSNSQEVISSYGQSGSEAAVELIRNSNRMELLTASNAEIGFLRQLMLLRLKRAALASEENQQESLYALVAGLFVTLLIAGFAGFLAYRDSGLRASVEQDLRQVAALQKAILDSVACSVFATDNQNLITIFNRASEEMLGFATEEMVGQVPPDNFLWRSFPERESSDAEVPQPFGSLAEIVRANSGDGSGALELTMLCRDGRRIAVSLMASQIVDVNGTVLGYVAMAHDLTDRNKTKAIVEAYVKEIEAANELAQQQNRELKRTADELKESRDSAVAATRMKSVFLANMSHEIRTPMNGVIGMTHLLLSTPLSDKQIGYARTVRQSAESLLAILNDILDLSKMEAGKMTLETFPFDLRLMLEDLCDVMAPAAHDKRLELNCVFPPGAPSRVMGDPGRLRQVLTNLMANAIKFTERGEVSVTVRVLRENQKRVTYRFVVADTGIGIRADRQDRIFDSFTQGDGSTTRQFGGTGLGLTISRQLTELMGGEIGVTSQQGAGSEFWIELAFQKQPTPVMEPLATRQDLAGIRVLVADDSATNRFILREILTSWNCRVMEAANGTEAVSAISLSANDPFSCVIMDLNMPEMDGVEAARAIKSLPRNKDLPLLLLSSSGTAPGESGSAGLFAEVLSKPVRTSPLFNAMTAVTGLAAPASSKPVEVELTITQPLKGVNVLVVEDNAVNQLVVMELLESWGCVVEAADNGKLGVEAYQRTAFDVILMDVQMPVMDGFDATGAIRRLEADSKTHIEIIAMTANAMSGDRERCLRAGMDAYLSKPLQPSALLERLVKSAGRLLATQTRLNPGEQFVATKFDLGRLDESCSGSDPLKIKVLERYLTTSLDSMAQISQAVVGADGQAAKSAAHALKGSSLTIGSHKIGDFCDELEELAVKPGFGADQRPLAESLRAEMMALHSEVKLYLEQLKQIQK